MLDKYSNFCPASPKTSESADGYVQTKTENRDWEDFYRNRWHHDKIVRSTHGCNCTGSCSWQVFVKNGVVTWELQQTDYPHTPAGIPNHEPRGCPRGASYSWYLYNSGRVKHPMVRRELVEAYRAAKAVHHDPVDAWEAVVSDEATRKSYMTRRGLGGFLRVSWDEAMEIVAASNVYTIKKYGPDRIAGFSPIPGFSMVSYGAGTRYLSLIGGTCMSFYDFYCDLPPSSPQTWGEQTDVPESSDWYNSTFLMLWGSNVPVTRTPDSPFYTQVRYKGTKVVVVSPDFNDAAKFADVWLSPQQGTDSALGMAMGHVILKEFYIQRQIPYFQDYVRRFSDLPFLVKLEPYGEEGHYQGGMLLRASDFSDKLGLDKDADWQMMVFDEKSGRIVIPQGQIASRWDGSGKWNTNLKDVRDGSDYYPALSVKDRNDEILSVDFPYFGGTPYSNPYFNSHGQEDRVTRRVPVRMVKTSDGKSVAVCTVFDLMCAHYGVDRGLNDPDIPKSYDEEKPYTPAWGEKITGVKASAIISVARQFAENAAATKGRTMIIIGAGVNQWFHSDMNYRAAINCLVLCGCIGQSGGGWAHYVGQEKIRPMAGWAMYSFASDWNRPCRQVNATSYYYQHCDMWRYEHVDLKSLLSPICTNKKWDGMSLIDANVVSQRLGWLPLSPQYTVNSLEIPKLADKAGMTPQQYLCEKLHTGEIALSTEDLDNPVNFPRVQFIWRSNLLGCSGKGMEYFMRHLLGTQNNVLGEDLKAEGGMLPKIEKWRDPVYGKLDLCVTVDFRMTTSSLHSDIVLPAATWYEKDDINSTDMHPFIHPFCAAVDPCWEARTDWDFFKGLSAKLSELSKGHLGVERDLVMTPMMHDSPSEITEPLHVSDWKENGTVPVPGCNLGNLTVVERDYSQIYNKFTSVGPLADAKGIGNKGVSWSVTDETSTLAKEHGVVEREGASKGRPNMQTAIQAADTILIMSPESNGKVAIKSWENLDKRTGLENVKLSEQDGDIRINYFNIVQQPRKSLTCATWSGLESDKVGYNPGYINVHYAVPWRTQTGRQQIYQDHPWMLDFGSGFVQYRSPLYEKAVDGLKERFHIEGKTLAINVMTPHSKWGIHSTWSDNLLMLTLGRGGPVIWISEKDAAKIDANDNDWIEVFNDNGVTVCRAVVSQRMPEGGSFIYHNPERTVNMPLSAITGNRGGLHNSIARICPNPIHMIGGYAQLSYTMNYYGCIGSNRDEICIIRKLDSVEWE